METILEDKPIKDFRPKMNSYIIDKYNKIQTEQILKNFKVDLYENCSCDN